MGLLNIPTIALEVIVGIHSATSNTTDAATHRRILAVGTAD
jgi:hypothetical protein